MRTSDKSFWLQDTLFHYKQWPRANWFSYNRFTNLFSCRLEASLKYQLSPQTHSDPLISWVVLLVWNEKTSMHLRQFHHNIRNKIFLLKLATSGSIDEAIWRAIEVSSVTRFGKIPPLWPIFKNLWQYIESLFGFGQSFLLSLVQFVCFWAHFHWRKWPNIEDTIWSSGHTLSKENPPE